jgi:hypothetical protein
MKRLVSILTAGSLVVGALIVSAGASFAEARPLPRALGAINVISGSQSSSMLVRLRAPATLRQPEFSKTSVATEGSGDLVGFALAQEPFDFDKSAAVIAARMPSKSGGSPILSLGFRLRESSKGYHLPAGTYRLYLLADGPAAKVTFQLKGVTGTQNLRPSKPAEAVIKTPNIRPSAEIQNVYTGGADYRLSNSGILFNHLSVTHEAHAASVSQFCYSAGAPEPAENPAPYAPGCPSTNQKAIFTTPATYVTTSPSEVDFYSGALASAGEWGQGFSYESGGIVDSIGFAALWLELE